MRPENKTQHSRHTRVRRITDLSVNSGGRILVRILGNRRANREIGSTPCVPARCILSRTRQPIESTFHIKFDRRAGPRLSLSAMTHLPNSQQDIMISSVLSGVVSFE